MTPATKDKLRVAWYGRATAGAIARRHHLSSRRRVLEFWHTEKAAGRLPQGERPNFRQPVGVTPVEPAAVMALDAEIGRAEARLGDEALCIAAADPLLARLAGAHGVAARGGGDDAVPDDTHGIPAVMMTSAGAHRLARHWDEISNRKCTEARNHGRR